MVVEVDETSGGGSMGQTYSLIVRRMAVATSRIALREYLGGDRCDGDTTTSQWQRRRGADNGYRVMKTSRTVYTKMKGHPK